VKNRAQAYWPAIYSNAIKKGIFNLWETSFHKVKMIKIGLSRLPAIVLQLYRGHYYYNV